MEGHLLDFGLSSVTHLAQRQSGQPSVQMGRNVLDDLARKYLPGPEFPTIKATIVSIKKDTDIVFEDEVESWKASVGTVER